MRVLLDECIDEELRHCFRSHVCQTCRYAGLKCLANGQLIAAAEKSGFEVLLTVDQNIPYQQSLRGHEISVMVRQARTTTFADPMALVPDVLTELEDLKPGQYVRIGIR